MLWFGQNPTRSEFFLSGANLIALAATIAATYAALLAAYFATCFVVLRLNAWAPHKQIQARRETAAQIRRDRVQSIKSLACIAAMFGCGHWMYATMGWGIPQLEPSVAIYGLTFIASLLIFDTWFYWLHRLIHSKALYRWVHLWHHETVSPEVWSNNSDRIIDNLFLQSYWLVAHFLIPVAPAVLIAHKLYDQVTGVVGHSGYEHAGRIAWPPSPLVSVTHHDQHHRYGRCNYATHFSLWDRLMGTLHPTHDAETKRNIAREAATRSAPAQS